LGWNGKNPVTSMRLIVKVTNGNTLSFEYSI
jgi:hypothetical protein